MVWAEIVNDADGPTPPPDDPPKRESDVTRLLSSAAAGDSRASAELMAVVYDELRQLARRQLAREKPGHTLEPTALVNEAFLRLSGTDAKWENRRHFFGAAAIAMRRILIERARAATGPKRGSGKGRQELTESVAGEVGSGGVERSPTGIIDYLALDEAVTALEAHDSELATLVSLRFFAGLTIEAVADVLGVSTRSVNRDWNVARAWLYQHMNGREPQV